MPGKFEGEPRYVEHLWTEYVMHGLGDDEFADDAGTLYTQVVLGAEDDELTSQFPELEDAYCVVLWESDQGFVHSALFETEAEYHEAVLYAFGDEEEPYAE